MGKSRSFRALWALEEAGVDYDYVAVDFASSDENGAQSDDYLKLNTQGKVPTLVDGDLVLTESGAIMNYIAANSADLTLIPSNSLVRRAKYDEMMFFVVTELEQGLWSSGKHRFALPEDYRIPEMLNTATFEFNKAMKTLQHLFNGEGFVVGDEFTMADLILAHTLTWAESFKFDVPEQLLSYRNKMYYRKACKKVIKLLES